MQEWEIDQVNSTVQGAAGIPCWNIVMLRADGELHEHVMPKAIFAIRAAEYGMDPEADFDEILDMVLHEGHMQDPELAPHDQDVAGAVGYNTVIADGTRRAATLYTAETLKDAREAHRMRIKSVKENSIKINHDNMKPADKKRLRQGHLDIPRSVFAEVADSVRLERRQIRGRPDGKPLKG